MQSLFSYVVFGAVGLFLVVGLLSMLTRNDKLYDQIGQGGLSMEDSHSPSDWELAPDAPIAQAEREQEIRQMLGARRERQLRQGQEPVDIDAELARLTEPVQDDHSPGSDDASHNAGLSEEVRQLVVARNERRVRKGEEPLDVEAEVQRTLRELST
jgi:hypothetical protein